MLLRDTGMWLGWCLACLLCGELGEHPGPLHAQVLWERVVQETLLLLQGSARQATGQITPEDAQCPLGSQIGCKYLRHPQLLFSFPSTPSGLILDNSTHICPFFFQPESHCYFSQPGFQPFSPPARVTRSTLALCQPPGSVWTTVWALRRASRQSGWLWASTLHFHVTPRSGHSYHWSVFSQPS